MKRALTFLSAAALAFSLAACGASNSTGSSISGQAVVSSPSPEMTEEDVLAAYDQAAEVYDWFDLYSLPASGALVTEDGQPYAPNRSGTPYQKVDYDGLNSYADLDIRVRSCFSPELADKIMGDSVNYRDIGGKLYTASGARGSNLYLLDKTVKAKQVDENHWTVTLTFWADFTDQELQADGNYYPVATTGYSQTVLDYENTANGWRFTDFCPSDDLDPDADTVFTINYYQDFEVTCAYQNYSDWKLVCYLIHADGAYAEAPFDLLYQRFMERPEDILKVLALLDSSPYAEKGADNLNIDGIVASPGYSAAAWYSDQSEEFLAVLNRCTPATAAEQTVLGKIRTAFQSSAETQQSSVKTEFSFVVPGEKRVLTLGTQKGSFPWDYDLTGTPTNIGSGDTFGTCYEQDCGDLQLFYSISPDDGTEYLYKMSTSVHYDQSEGYLCTPRGLYCGYDEKSLLDLYPSAVNPEDTFEDDTYDACFIYEPGGEASCKHICFYMKDGLVRKIEIEDLRDGCLLNR